MAGDRETLAAYATSASEYAERVTGIADDPQRQDLTDFLDGLPPGGALLDLGCGPGHWAARMAALGFAVTAVDAAPEMADLAWQQHGIRVRIESFDHFSDTACFHGIWANFSLLHLPRAEFPAMLQRLHRALHPGGRLHIAMKLGHGEDRDRLGRFYAYYGVDELNQLLRDAGFTPFRHRTGTAKGLAGSPEPYSVITAHG